MSCAQIVHVQDKQMIQFWRSHKNTACFTCSFDGVKLDLFSTGCGLKLDIAPLHAFAYKVI